MNNIDMTWNLAVTNVLKHGTPLSSRDGDCCELINKTTVVDMNRPILTNANRKLSYKFMVAEAAWLISGDDKLSTIVPYNKAIAKYSDDGKTFFGAYGPRWLEQANNLVDRLLDDNSRQAVFTIWRQNPPRSKDIPCTISIQFLLRDNVLTCIDNMRSSDLFLGWPYDVFCFSMLSAYVALLIGDRTGELITLGDIHLNAASQHIYKRNWQACVDCLPILPPAFVYQPINLEEFDTATDLLSHLTLVSDCMLQRVSLPANSKHEWLREAAAFVAE